MKTAHAKLVLGRRKAVLVDALARIVPAGAEILDVGTGDGGIARLLSERLNSPQTLGIDVFARPRAEIPVTRFDGKHLPFPDNSFDVVTFVDVLHHTDNPSDLLAEAGRVARRHVVIKDHLAETRLDHLTLRAMDWVGNAAHGVVLPYNYDSRRVWEERFARTGLVPEVLTSDIPLYPWPFSLAFGRSLHFIARLNAGDGTPSSGRRNS